MEGLRSKNWEEFAKPAAPKMNFVFTVCDNAAQEMCPVWPGQPMTAHWGVPDPAEAKGTPEQIERAFRDAYLLLERRISLFLSLPLSSLDKLAIQKEINQIGHQSDRIFAFAWWRNFWARHFSWRRLSAQASWRSGLRTGTGRWLCWRTRSLPVQRLSYLSSLLDPFQARISIRWAP